MQVWSQCLNINNITPNTNYREHFAIWATKLRHFKGHLSLPERTILAAMKVLGEEEHAKEKTEPSETHNNKQQKNTNNWGNQRNSGWSNLPPRNNRWNSHNTNTSTREETNSDEKHVINSLNTTNQSVSPYIQCTIEGEEITLLVDTGATISVLTKEIVDIITHKNPRIPQLPVTEEQISNAVGKKVCKVSEQIFCECKIDNIYLQTNFIQVENINEKGIIGADILSKYAAQIKFKENTVQIMVDEISFANKEPRLMNEREHLLNEEINENNMENDQITLNNQEYQIFTSLLNKYNSIFSDQPGKITKFQCQIKIKPGDPIYQRQYPIPISKIPKQNHHEEEHRQEVSEFVFVIDNNFVKDRQLTKIKGKTAMVMRTSLRIKYLDDYGLKIENKSALQATQRRTGYNTPCTPLSFVENNTLELINSTGIFGYTENMLESDPICDEIEVLNNNEINESNELFPEESVENEVFLKNKTKKVNNCQKIG
ncbi:AP2/ERF domain-containing protein PFD0985w-like [Aphis craccivora]|uniref:AP2/ERF domain-containing protein PFD0985w-like n=1 Tax=Aphis craccivora TaxID=307492 RepID=A0A6G0YAF0_APHCR|nr:AP2/ERF domain-containing protein PFD0985w-like [Aphis craccivora]